MQNGKTLNRIVADYIATCRDRSQHELQYYASQRSLTDAIREAALSRIPREKLPLRIVRHPHQRRLPLRVLQHAEQKLQDAAPKLRRARSFDELHDLVEQTIEPIPGIGELAVYDIAHRISAFLGHEPDAVHLHAGTRVGALALNLRGSRVDRTAFPRAFRALTPAQIEDCLCIYSDQLRGALQPRNGGCSPGSAMSRNGTCAPRAATRNTCR